MARTRAPLSCSAPKSVKVRRHTRNGTPVNAYCRSTPGKGSGVAKKTSTDAPKFVASSKGKRKKQVAKGPFAMKNSKKKTKKKKKKTDAWSNVKKNIYGF